MSGSVTSTLSTSDAITQFYQNILQRAPDISGLDNWTAAVNSGALTLLDVENAIIASPEAQAFVVPVVEMYTALGRAPDQDGLAAWVQAYESGESLTDIAGGFLGSVEGLGIYGTGAGSGNANIDANTAFITTVYHEVLGRLPDTGGLSFWVSQLTTGTMTPAQVLERIVGSPETQAGDATGVASFLVGAGQGTYATTLDGATTPEQTFTLTPGINTLALFTGGAGDDTFDASEVTNALAVNIPTWSAGDTIDGGDGTNTFNVTQTAAINTPLGATVANIQEANLVSANGVGVTGALNTTSWGLTTLNVFDGGATALTAADTTAVNLTDSANGNITVLGGSDVSVTASGMTTGIIVVGSPSAAPTGTVDVTATSDPAATTGSMGTIRVTGGTAVVVTVNEVGALNNTISGGVITVIGTAATTDVSISQNPAVTASSTVTGVVDGSVFITDAKSASTTDEGSINNISLVNYTTATINDNALTNLSVAGGSGNIIIDNSGLTTPTNKTLDLTADGLTGGTLDDADVYTTLNITTAENNSRLANITFGALTALTVAGTEALTLTSTAGLTALKTVTVSDAAGLTGNFSGPTVTAVDASATTGDSTVTIDGSKATYTGGAGADNVTLTPSVVSKAISGGDGIDTLTMDATAAATASGSSDFAGLITDFEQLVLTGATNQSVDLAVLGITGNVSTSGGNGLTLHNLDDGGTLALTGAGTAYTIDNLPLTVGATETLNLTLSANASAAGTNFAATGITASNMQTIAITTVDTEATPAGANNHSVTLLGNTAETITVAGNNGLTLTATDTAATTVDASGIELGGFTFTSGALANAADISGSATGTNTVNFSAATHAVTYTGGSGTDAITSTNSSNNTISTDEGSDTVNVGNGNNTITAGDGADTIVAGNGNNIISVGDGADTITVGAGNNTITAGAGTDIITVGGGLNAIDIGNGSNTMHFLAAGATGLIYSTVNGAATGDVITHAGTATGAFAPTQVTLGNNAQFSDFLNAAASGAVGGGNEAWFQFRGNTYLVADESTATSFTGGTDYVVGFNGLHNLDNSTLAAGSLTLGSHFG